MKAQTAKKHDVTIVGGVPAGAVTALYLLKAGVKDSGKGTIPALLHCVLGLTPLAAYL